MNSCILLRKCANLHKLWAEEQKKKKVALSLLILRGAQSSLGGAQFSFGGAQAVIWEGAPLPIAPRGAKPGAWVLLFIGYKLITEW